MYTVILFTFVLHSEYKAVFYFLSFHNSFWGHETHLLPRAPQHNRPSITDARTLDLIIYIGFVYAASDIWRLEGKVKRACPGALWHGAWYTCYRVVCALSALRYSRIFKQSTSLLFLSGRINITITLLSVSRRAEYLSAAHVLHVPRACRTVSVSFINC